MLKFKPFVSTIALVAALAGAAPWHTARADSLLMKRVQQEQGMNLPGKGMSMAEVERRFGAPTAKLPPRGGGSKQQPVINRWEYPGYIVYFERSHVVHTVLNTPAGNNTNPSQAH
ncbi:hypothetical protein FHW69_001562 [Luteibacter sp. Sphag1AF]|uniref:hypothetical protein n=1 Tax=Luteibacter sp. Sphag1AF TaxID=2587031 RepID=UPI00161E040A|nr:hypothetical protein [Luteibacter sp. Sphag1AF]MBB3226961.1 hypothetical protein [Luteibacter sp. Sphag1AF]